MSWNGDQAEVETRSALLAGEVVYSHGHLFWASGADYLWGGCTVDGCEGCDMQFNSIDEYFEWLKAT